MDFKELYKTLEENRYFVFSFDDLQVFFPRVSKGNLKKLIYRWKDKGWLVSLKRGLYELTYPKQLTIPDVYIANRLYYPSYVSLETALSHYSIIPEVSMAVTSLTTKPTRRFINKYGLFIYHTIRPKMYIGYTVEKQRSFEFFIAEPEKALIDYLYFSKLHKSSLKFRDERFDKNMIKKMSKRKLKKYARLYNLDIGELYAYL